MTPRRTVQPRRPGRCGAAVGVALALALGAAGCVSKAKHEQAVAELDRTRASEAQAKEQLAKALAEIAKLSAAMDAYAITATELEGARADLTTRLGTSEEQNAELGGRLEAASRSLEALQGQKGELSAEVTALRTHLDALRAAQAATEARLAQQRAILEAFRSMIDAGELAVVVEGGRVLLVLETDVLFDPGVARVSAEGRRVIADVGRRLAAMKDLELQVGGHTDDTPIRTERFPSNWELSTARAVEVVRLLLDAGVPPRRLSAAGFGEHRPAVPNDGPAGRAKNRRIEIGIVPDLAPLLEAPKGT